MHSVHCHKSGCHSPHYSCTSPMDYNSHHSLHLRHTHSHPPLHQSHSCHQSLINPDCLTTPAPHSHTHTHISSALPCTHRKVLFSPVWHFRAVSLLLPGLFSRLWPFAACLLDPACLVISSLSATCPDHCIAPVDDSALPLCHLFSLLDSACLTSSCLSIKLQLDLTTLPLHYRRLRRLRSSGFISATQPNHGLHRPTPTSSPGRPVYWGVCSPVLWAVLSGTAVRWNSFQRLISFRAQ